MLLCCIFVLLGISFSVGTSVVRVSGKDVGDVVFRQLDGHSLTGRPAYMSEDGSLFLYHLIIEPVQDGVGRWIIADGLWVDDTALQFINSWAVTPCLIDEIHDNVDKGWLSFEGESWGLDPSFRVTCTQDPDDLIYLDVPGDIWTTGFFVKMSKANADVPNSYMKIKRYEAANNLFLYKLGHRWLLGDTPGVDNAIAFVDDDEDIAEAKDLGALEWSFHAPDMDPENPWVRDWVDVMAMTEDDASLMEFLRKHRSIRDFPSIQGESGGLYSLRNGMAMPAIGLGTGGIPDEKMYNTTLDSLRMGYRMLDLAREYYNEVVVRDIFTDTAADQRTPKPHEVFLLSKVWPTELGFDTTSRAIHASRRDLGVTFVDQYMLHWPACYADVAWMHCDSVVDPAGTWQQSYKALEKAYAEGDIMSIGISNFDIELLDQVHVVSDTLPHLVQNYASVGDDDTDVREWCRQNGAFFQPYASARNEADIKNVSPATAEALKKIALSHSKSVHAVIYRYFLQLGDSVIPRSTNVLHLMENLANLKWKLTDAEMKQLSKLALIEGKK